MTRIFMCELDSGEWAAMQVREKYLRGPEPYNPEAPTAEPLIEEVRLENYAARQLLEFLKEYFDD